MPTIPGVPGVPGGGSRQQRAAQLRAEMEAKRAAAQQAQAAPTGAGFRPIKAGDTLAGIAAESGMAPDAIWNDPLNRQVRERCGGDPSRLEAGDALYVRERQVHSGGPVGQGEHVVREGECISSIAKNTGHFWETIWNDAGNSGLKAAREDPNVLLPGDRVTVPDLRPKQEPGETEMRHRFVRRGEPAKLRLRLLEGPSAIDQDDGAAQPQPDVPRGNVPYRLTVDGQQFEGTADADGWVECAIPGNARRGSLCLYPDTDQQEEFEVTLGQVAPVSELCGVRQRLKNLGFESGSGGEDVVSPDLEAALRAFQKQNGVSETGEPDEATRRKLVDVHGC